MHSITERRAAGRALRETVPHSAHADPGPPRESPRPDRVPRTAGRITPGRPDRRAPWPHGREPVRLPSWCGDGHGPRPRVHASHRPARAGVRRRAHPQLRQVRDARAQCGVLHQRLRRDAARSVGVGREAARREPAPRRRRSAGSAAPSATSRCSPRCAPTASAWRGTRRCEPSTCGTTTPTIDDVIAHFPKKDRPRVERDVDKAQRKDHRRAVAQAHRSRTTGSCASWRTRRSSSTSTTPTTTSTTSSHMLDDYRATPARRPPAPLRPLPARRRRATRRRRRAASARGAGSRSWKASDHPGGDRIDPAGEGGAGVGARAVRRARRARPPRPPRRRRSAAHARRASDIFLGWCEAPSTGRQYYVRQLWDLKGRSDLTAMNHRNLTYHGALCGWALARRARAHRRRGADRRLPREPRRLRSRGHHLLRRVREDHRARPRRTRRGRGGRPPRGPVRHLNPRRHSAGQVFTDRADSRTTPGHSSSPPRSVRFPRARPGSAPARGPLRAPRPRPSRRPSPSPWTAAARRRAGRDDHDDRCDPQGRAEGVDARRARDVQRWRRPGRRRPRTPTAARRRASASPFPPAAERALHRAAEVRRHEAAEHRHAEGAAELAGRVVDRRADARLVQRQRPHDRPGRRRGGDAHAERLHHDGEREPPVARGHAARDGSSAMPGPAIMRPEATTRRWPNRSTSLADCVADTRYASAHGRMRTPADSGL